MKNKIPEIVLSEPDLLEAIFFLKELPYSVTKNMPESWSKKRLLNSIKDAIENYKAKIKVDTVVPVTVGVWAIIKPFGIDLAGDTFNRDERLQVWLMIRKVSTKPDSLYTVRESE